MLPREHANNIREITHTHIDVAEQFLLIIYGPKFEVAPMCCFVCALLYITIYEDTENIDLDLSYFACFAPT